MLTLFTSCYTAVIRFGLLEAEHSVIGQRAAGRAPCKQAPSQWTYPAVKRL